MRTKGVISDKELIGKTMITRPQHMPVNVWAGKVRDTKSDAAIKLLESTVSFLETSNNGHVENAKASQERIDRLTQDKAALEKLVKKLEDDLAQAHAQLEVVKKHEDPWKSGDDGFGFFAFSPYQGWGQQESNPFVHTPFFGFAKRANSGVSEFGNDVEQSRSSANDNDADLKKRRVGEFEAQPEKTNTM